MKEVTIVWLDSKEAKVITATPSDVVNSVNISSDEPGMPADARSPEVRKSKKQARENYFKQLMEALDKSREIVLFGPDNTKEEFLDYLDTNAGHLHSKVIGVESSMDMPEEKIIARGRKYI